MNWAADDFDAIRERREQIRKDEEPRCPITPERLLSMCLQSARRCPDNCRFQSDWVGPHPDVY